MEKIKKTILQAITTEMTVCTGTTGTCHVIIPDLTAVYYMKIGLKQISRDLGFFDVLAEETSTDEYQFIDINGDTYVDYNNDIFIE